MMVRISDITVGVRRRTEFGDIAGLAASIERYGLLHPIVVTDDLVLVAGERRLRACVELGWTEIEAKLLGQLTDTERREIELEENLQRKDLTAYERSRTLVALAETAAEVLREGAETSFKLNEVSGKRGPDPKADSQAAIAERLGTAQSEISKARAHVAIVEEHPALADEPQSVALDYGRAIEEQPELAESELSPREIVELDREKKKRERAEAKARRAEEQAIAERVAALAGDPDGSVARAQRKAELTAAHTQARRWLLADAAAVWNTFQPEEMVMWRMLETDALAWFDAMRAAQPASMRIVR